MTKSRYGSPSFIRRELNLAITCKKYHCELEGQANIQKLRNEEKKGNLKNAVFEISEKKKYNNGKMGKVRK